MYGIWSVESKCIQYSIQYEQRFRGEFDRNLKKKVSIVIRAVYAACPRKSAAVKRIYPRRGNFFFFSLYQPQTTRIPHVKYILLLYCAVRV